MRLKEDHYSSVKNSVRYGKKGEKLILISDAGEVLIVEGEKGDRFAVRKDKVINQ